MQEIKKINNLREYLFITFESISLCLDLKTNSNPLKKYFMGMLKEFKEFAMRGNVIDLAVAVIIGGAFGKIIASLVADIIMPPIGLLLGGVNFVDLKWVMKAAEVVDGVKKEAVSINYGSFLQVTFDFLIIAFCIFLLIKGINRLGKKKEEAPAPVVKSNEELLLAEIRDLLKEKK